MIQAQKKIDISTLKLARNLLKVKYILQRQMAIKEYQQFSLEIIQSFGIF